LRNDQPKIVTRLRITARAATRQQPQTMRSARPRPQPCCSQSPNPRSRADVMAALARMPTTMIVVIQPALLDRLSGIGRLASLSRKAPAGSDAGAGQRGHDLV